MCPTDRLSDAGPNVMMSEPGSRLSLDPMSRSSSRPAQAGTPDRDLAAALAALNALVDALRLGSRNIERRLGISGAQLFVLQKLEEGPVSSLKELAARTFTHQSSVSVVVTRLVARGLVARTTFPDDARRVTLALTARGRALLAKAPETLQARLLASLERLSRTERKSLVDALERLVREAGITAATPMTFFGDEGLRPRLARRDRRQKR
jgi:DNA-binding MarR family transcriptional regulator